MIFLADGVRKHRGASLLRKISNKLRSLGVALGNHVLYTLAPGGLCSSRSISDSKMKASSLGKEFVPEKSIPWGNLVYEREN